MSGTWISGQYVKKVVLGNLPKDNYRVSDNAGIRFYPESGCISIQMYNQKLVAEQRYVHLSQGFKGQSFICRATLCISTQKINEIKGIFDETGS